MNSLPFQAALADYQREAEALFAALQSGAADAAWEFKWLHPRFRDRMVDAVQRALPTLTLEDAQLVTAHQYAFETWQDLTAFTEEIAHGGAAAEYEAAVEAVVSGDVAALRGMLQANPSLIRARSPRRHHATLLHYIAANGVEGMRQKTPPNAIEVARLLLDAGAEPDALADLYDNQCTTMSMLVSSSHPHKAGLQAQLAELLLDRGARLDGPGSEWQSAILTALIFGYADTARVLAHRADRIDNIVIAAGLGDADAVARLLPAAESRRRHEALALAAQLGHTEVVRLLLDAGEDPSRYNPDGFHAHATPLHQAIWSDRMAVVRLLVERGARLDIRDKVFDGTPLDWAVYGKKTEAADYLRSLNLTPP